MVPQWDISRHMALTKLASLQSEDLQWMYFILFSFYNIYVVCCYLSYCYKKPKDIWILNFQLTKKNTITYASLIFRVPVSYLLLKTLQ